MYSRYAERQGWKIEIMSSNFTELGGVKEIIFMIEGKGAYSRLKYESGVHRVQRVPPPNPAEGSTLPLPRWQCFPKPKMWTLK